MPCLALVKKAQVRLYWLRRLPKYSGVPLRLFVRGIFWAWVSQLRFFILVIYLPLLLLINQ
ncbi:DUF1891 domain-containing protein [Acinetobacter defluvii]|uniref:DUF1891 domain-containing protein n=1 Tax=Acinetobacter defluvii TaxID=1871111 RepID=A0A2S2FFN2_9GAMM|nr:DUF1891 domain-containing protein [Acinetobacter defluvii]